MSYELIVLVVGTMDECNNSCIGPGLTLSKLSHLRFHPNRVTVEERLREANFVPSEISNRRAERRVAYGYANHQTQGKRTVNDALPVLCVLAAIVLVEVEQRWIVGQGTEPYVVGLSNGPPQGVVEHLADGELIEI
jgi:hypothetical protein